MSFIYNTFCPGWHEKMSFQEFQFFMCMSVVGSNSSRLVGCNITDHKLNTDVFNQTIKTQDFRFHVMLTISRHDTSCKITISWKYLSVNYCSVDYSI